MRIWIIDDNDDSSAAVAEVVADLLPEALVKRFRDLRKIDETVGPDVVIVDVSAVCPVSQCYMFGDFLWPFANRFPGASVIILSGLAEIVREDVMRTFAEYQVENQTVFVVLGYGFSHRLAKALTECGLKLKAEAQDV